jgi:transcriptional regulator with XRE-family HTH domain
MPGLSSAWKLQGGQRLPVPREPPIHMLPEQHERRRQWTAPDPAAPIAVERRRLTLVEPAARPIHPKSAGAIPEHEPDLGTRLRLERERRGITLASIADHTKIRTDLLQGLERNDVSRWPAGIFRRAFIRAYAEAVGLDADVITREFFCTFRDSAEPPPVDTPISRPAEATKTHGDPALRLTFADMDAAGATPGALAEAPRRALAVAWDMAVVLVIGATLFAALHEFWIPLALAMMGYYSASIALFGDTPGVALFLPKSRSRVPRHSRSWHGRLPRRRS